MDDEFKPDLRQLEADLDKMGNKVHSFKKMRYMAKITGNMGIIYAILIHNWFMAFILWLLFFPDSEHIIRISKKIISSFKDKKGY